MFIDLATMNFLVQHYIYFSHTTSQHKLNFCYSKKNSDTVKK